MSLLSTVFSGLLHHIPETDCCPDVDRTLVGMCDGDATPHQDFREETRHPKGYGVPDGIWDFLVPIILKGAVSVGGEDILGRLSRRQLSQEADGGMTRILCVVDTVL